ncbi:M20/M25/M40 family metallo-hydrolase [Aneurinibacillus sp. REN35]|uniref:M20/M25/M40 family metallo-hydrolase n=1 Tax=Aneurinibacillus sp. REN35 TaxID=3237286 RepID=UPI0035283450
MLHCVDEVLSLTKELVHTESIVNSEGEQVLAKQIYNQVKAWPYFAQHPQQVRCIQTVHDNVTRSNVLACVRGTKTKSQRTIILMGHIDTVGIDDYGQLKDVACNPDALMTALRKESLPSSIQAQLESNEWLFGRGVLDMKSGVASNLYLLRYYAEHPEELAGNLVLVAECDEEDSSHGILSALYPLKEWEEQYGFDYIAAINSDLVSPRYEGDTNRYVYKGTVGKLLPSFYITGAETHVGACFEGLDPNFIASELTRLIDYNPELCDEAYGEITAPPVSLKQMDLKPSYTVQTALAAYVYYNFLVYSWSPKEVLEKLKSYATQAFDHALELFDQRYRTYCERSGEPYQKAPWTTRVYTYEELHEQLTDEWGERYTTHMTAYRQELAEDPSLDSRMYAARVVEEAWKWMKDKRPAIIVFYSSIYSPRVELTDQTEKERNLSAALEEAVAYVQPHYEHPIQIRHFFPYISDMSFVALSDDEESIQSEAANNPSFGYKYNVDYDAIRALNVPVINVGPYGYDAHKKYERTEIKFSLEIVPNITNRMIRSLLGS